MPFAGVGFVSYFFFDSELFGFGRNPSNLVAIKAVCNFGFAQVKGYLYGWEIIGGNFRRYN